MNYKRFYLGNGQEFLFCEAADEVLDTIVLRAEEIPIVELLSIWVTDGRSKSAVFQQHSANFS
ncbi:hypothetical protein SAMN05421666_1144 [Roseovarius nanhaiticus]|uniref:Uncharacterized protein n=1 Tax=Roseovarius nanhaiticus TaxID=573024 RepID=A0A1N7FL49_9RHOB|nr:hypothetical protein [Roseovarius nanhaiticus]SEK51843.1 hypothetical protein SAMN05216208_0992 [Roseovarius nanhaiticus]SIS01069.1 hypothetical protein SAMN05421666_1144 [Roseovarius nanhaiticus]